MGGSLLGSSHAKPHTNEYTLGNANGHIHVYSFADANSYGNTNADANPHHYSNPLAHTDIYTHANSQYHAHVHVYPDSVALADPELHSFGKPIQYAHFVIHRHFHAVEYADAYQHAIANPNRNIFFEPNAKLHGNANPLGNLDRNPYTHRRTQPNTKPHCKPHGHANPDTAKPNCNRHEHRNPECYGLSPHSHADARTENSVPFWIWIRRE